MAQESAHAEATGLWGISGHWFTHAVADVPKSGLRIRLPREVVAELMKRRTFSRRRALWRLTCSLSLHQRMDHCSKILRHRGLVPHRQRIPITNLCFMERSMRSPILREWHHAC